MFHLYSSHKNEMYFYWIQMHSAVSTGIQKGEIYIIQIHTSPSYRPPFLWCTLSDWFLYLREAEDMLCLPVQWPAGKQRKTLVKKVISQRVKIAGHTLSLGAETRLLLWWRTQEKGAAGLVMKELLVHVCTSLLKYFQRHWIDRCLN